jgi:hypothetical protein
MCAHVKDKARTSLSGELDQNVKGEAAAVGVRFVHDPGDKVDADAWPDRAMGASGR